MATRYYSNVAPPTTLSAGINAITTTITIASAAGLPPFQPFTLAIDPNTPSMELVEVTAAAGTTLTVTRAIDGTSATLHNAGAVVMHVSSARDFAEANAHINTGTNVHGLSGGAAVVGTTTLQTLTNKTINSPTINDGTITNTQITTNDPVTTGNLTANGNFSTTGTADITGNTHILANLDIEGTLTTGSGPGFDGDAQIGGNLNVSDGAQITTTSNTNATLNIQKNVGQTSNLQEWSFGTPLAVVNSFGEASFAREVSTGASVFTAAAGWSLNNAQMVKTAGVITLNVVLQRTGANLVASATGDMADTAMGTINANWRPNSNFNATADFGVPVQNSIGSGVANMTTSSGVITLRNWSSGGTISTGNNIGLTMTYVS